MSPKQTHPSTTTIYIRSRDTTHGAGPSLSSARLCCSFVNRVTCQLRVAICPPICAKSTGLSCCPVTCRAAIRALYTIHTGSSSAIAERPRDALYQLKRCSTVVRIAQACQREEHFEQVPRFIALQVCIVVYTHRSTISRMDTDLLINTTALCSIIDCPSPVPVACTVRQCDCFANVMQVLL